MLRRHLLHGHAQSHAAVVLIYRLRSLLVVVVQCQIGIKRPKLLHVHYVLAHLATVAVFLYLGVIIYNKLLLDLDFTANRQNCLSFLTSSLLYSSHAEKGNHLQWLPASKKQKTYNLTESI